MKSVLKKIITLGVCFFVVFTTCALADVMEPDMPVKPHRNDNYYFYNVGEEPIATPYEEENTITSNTTKRNSKHTSDEDDEEINYAVILVAVAGTIAVITAISIVILAFTSKKE